MAENMKVLIKKRGSIKARLTLFKNYLDGIVTQLCTEQTNVIDADTSIELQSRLERLNSVWVDFNEVQTSIEVSHDNFDEQLKERELFESIFYKVTTQSKRLLSESKKENELVNNNSGSAVLSSSINSVAMQTAPRLPNIPVPKFKGQYEQWLEFRDTYVSLIHNNKSITDIEKFHFLRGALEGDAKEVIHSLEFSAANYKTAWDLLCERYNNTSYLINNHVKLLFSLPTSTRESATELRKLLDAMVKHLRSLNTLGQETNTWDVMIIFLVTGKLDPITYREWEETKARDRLPTLDEFKQFLKNRAELLESLEGNKQNKPKVYSKSQTFITTNTSCSYCKGSHYINNCTDFLKLSVYNRFEQAKRLKLCLNCLKINHISKDCISVGCKKCKARHHTLLHYDKKSEVSDRSNGESQAAQEESTPVPSPSQNSSVVMAASQCNQACEVLLSTALVQVLDSQSYPHTCRVLLDSGSQSNLITGDLCKKLGIVKTNVKLSIVGVSQVVSEIQYKCEVTIQSLHNAFEKSISCLVVPKIGENIPGHYVNISDLQIPQHLKLADPKFHEPSPIDILIGAPLFYELLCIGQVQLGKNMPTLQKTRCGWVVSGQMCVNQGPRSHCNLSINLNIQQQLAKFWELEEPAIGDTMLSEDDKRCEEIFVTSTTRDSTGRFIVNIPFKDSVEKLGDSKQHALSRFFALENRLRKNPTLKEMYLSFMKDYEVMGHMSRLDNSSDDKASYYFPHHGVLNECSATTKLRVVFNGSAPTDTGISLNDIQFVGPKIQEDLLPIVLRFRQHNVVVCADIAKMYRMVQINPSQRSFQKIFWRPDPNDELHTYLLNTVTYGTASAPFLAIRCLKQLGYDNLVKYPVASNIILHDFYVDDLLTGGLSVDEVVKNCQEVDLILRSGCFELRKWVSNKPEVIKQVSGESNQSVNIHFGEKDETKTLGLYWSSSKDVLMYKIQASSISRITKRTVLSDISRIFDPLGLLSPVIICAKIILQQLWAEKLSWDESLPSDIDRKWRRFRAELPLLNDLKIPRQVACVNAIRFELHGFSDASKDAYGSCVFVRSIGIDGQVHTSLVLAKSKVAPMKTLTTPRLELCGALVLAQLAHKVKTSMAFNFDKIYLWCDSSVVLSWIATSSNLLQTFVGNRVSQIQSLTEVNQWHHVRSEHNPADILSRGSGPDDLVNCKMWWHGPDWLSKDEQFWPKAAFVVVQDIPELRKRDNMSFNTIIYSSVIDFSRFSNLSRLKRTVAYVFRFIANCKSRVHRQSGHLTVSELNKAMTTLIRIAQKQCFSQELKDLQNNKPLKSNGCLIGLAPFLDDDGIIRVGGRIQLSEFSFEKKHPAILSAKHPLSVLVFSFEHVRLLHAGPQLLLSSIRENYWPLGGRNLARNTVHKCVKCFRAKPVSKSPIMGMLPELRVRPMPPFHSTGIDYAGPFNIKSKRGRGAKLSKCYVALFVCFSTKAVHLELVSDLTTESFIATFRRFTSRRGKPQYVFSDNGRNFVGANVELKKLADFLVTQQHYLVNVAENEGITWQFIPAHSPHFGGLWEAGIKASKFHLKRVMANASLVFEDFCTLLTQIEAVLNSRPITPLSCDPSDLDALTPSHFLIGKRLTSIPDPNVKDTQDNRLARFQYIQKLYQHFWSRWSRDYIAELQTRTKWKSNQSNLSTGQLVLLKDDNLPPLKWSLGRIIKVHPGPDGKIRVASIKTQGSVVKRSFGKICVLPIEGTEVK